MCLKRFGYLFQFFPFLSHFFPLGKRKERPIDFKGVSGLERFGQAALGFADPFPLVRRQRQDGEVVDDRGVVRRWRDHFQFRWKNVGNFADATRRPVLAKILHPQPAVDDEAQNICQPAPLIKLAPPEKKKEMSPKTGSNIENHS